MSTRLPSRLVLAVFVLCAFLGCLASCQYRDQTSVRPVFDRASRGLWISPADLAALPMEGPAWRALAAEAHKSVSSADLSNQDDPSNVRVLAKAYFAIRTQDSAMAEEVRLACIAIRGTERGASALAMSRELLSYILAADLVGLPKAEDEKFKEWLREVRSRSFRGRSIRSTHEDRPNNWGTHAGATRLAIAAYLDDEEEIARTAHVLYGWLGEDEGWQGFDFGDGGWQPDGRRRYALNPAGATRKGHPVGGVLADDQRRAGPFSWPPPRENYVYEALQGVVVQAAMLERLGFPAWDWGDRGILRAFEWLHREANFVAEGDDTWIPHLVNRAYGSSFPAPIPSHPGKAMGFTDWTHGASTISGWKTR